MAISALVQQSEDKIARQAYQRRKDEIYFYNKERADDKRIMEQQAAEIAEKDAIIAQLQAQLANK